MPPAEYETLRSSLQLMVSDLDDARYKSRDPPDETHLPLIQTVHTGKRGRPSQPIDRTWLEHALKLRGPARVAKALKCSARHVRREALRLGLAEPAPPVFRPVEHPDGTSTRIHTTQTAPVSTLTDAELDAILRDVLSAYPRMGHVMLRGALIARGHRVPEARVRTACVRIRGAPPDFARRRIIRKKYRVAGPNSLVHHDGQHGVSVSRCMLLFWSHSPVRTYTVEIRHPLLHRRLLALRHRHPRSHQQPCRHRLGVVLRGSAYSWNAQSSPWRPWHGEPPSGGLDGGESR